MERQNQTPSFNSDFGCDAPICEEDINDDEQLTYQKFSHDKQQVTMFSWNAETRCRVAAVLLALLAAVLLIVNISLGVHHSQLADTHLTPEDTMYIGEEMDKLQAMYKSAIEKMTLDRKLLDTEANRQKVATWELEHQTGRSEDYQKQLDNIKRDIAVLAAKLPLIGGGCKHCPPGWILMNSACLYFSFSDVPRTWQKAREFCQLYDGDLITLDSRDKQNSTVAHLMKPQYRSSMGFWIGLKESLREGIWRWLDGRALVEGYWYNGQPNNAVEEHCVIVYPRENFFRAWYDDRCSESKKWICEKAPTPAS